MLIYFIIFFISFIFAWIAELSLKKNNKFFFFFFSCLAILIPSIMAGLRASGVGTDTKIYVDRIFEYMASSRGYEDIIRYRSLSDVELFYFLFNYLISRISTSLNAIYFSLSLLINTLFYSTFVYYYKKEKISFSFAYILYLLLFFNKSLNMTRQMISMAICFWSTRFIMEKKLYKYIITIIIAMLFHNSAILFLPVYYFKKISEDNNKRALIVKVSIIIAIIGIVILMNPVLSLLINLGILNDKYYTYISIYGNASNIKIIEWIPKIILVFILAMYYKILVKKLPMNRFFVYIFFIECATFLFGLNSLYAQRISYYFEVFLCLLIPQFIALCERDRDKLLIMCAILILFVSYSYAYYSLFQFDQTVPYIIDTNK